MGGGCHLGGTGTLQQNRVGEPLDPCDIHARGVGKLLDRSTRPDAGLNLFGTQHAVDLDVDMGLIHPGPVAAHRRTQSVVDADLDLVCGVVTLADDVFAVDIESDDLEFPHGVSSQAPRRPARQACQGRTLTQARAAARLDTR
jgi:hypothetical protein